MSTDSARGNFEDILTPAPPDLRAICSALRAVITRCAGDPVEVVWPRQQIASYGVGPKKMSQHYSYIGVQGSYVNLGFYHGSSLSDQAGLLEGTGKQLRHVKIHSVREARSPAIARLIREAISDRRAQKGES